MPTQKFTKGHKASSQTFSEDDKKGRRILLQTFPQPLQFHLIQLTFLFGVIFNTNLGADCIKNLGGVLSAAEDAAIGSLSTYFLPFCSFVHSMLSSSQMFPEPWMGSLRGIAYLGLQNCNLSPRLSPSHLRSSSHVLLNITSLYVPQRLAGRLFSSLKLSSLCSAIKACRIFSAIWSY